MKGVMLMTNFEKIKSMTIEEMSYYLCDGDELPLCPLHAPHCRDGNCPECFRKWLETEVKKEM